MVKLLPNLFSSQGYIPHGHCYLWQTPLVGLHIFSDALIALSYYAIPVALLYFVSKRQDMPFKKIFILFGVFIISCGTTHLIEILTLWYPVYWLSGSLKLFTALISFYTALSLIPLIPQFLSLKSPTELEFVNQQLQNQITETLQAQVQAQKLAEELERRVEERTEELSVTLVNLQKSQIQLVQSEKMSSLGQLVAGVAHEINNPVNFISGNLSHAEDYTNTLITAVRLYQSYYPQPKRELLEEVEEMELDFIFKDFPSLINSMTLGVKRIQGIVVSLRTFSRMDESEQKQVDIHEGIDSSLVILQSRLKGGSSTPKIKVIKEYADLPLVDCYPGQLNQVFMNILVNAIDSLESNFVNETLKGVAQAPQTPQIMISTHLESSPENLKVQEVKIRIADNGQGMTEETKKKLFDPFFTTKAIGKGTGLGLSISYQIITELHHGKIAVNSALGVGTEFVITIPLNCTAVLTN
jgi:two-component system NtrC family sensor kinase